MEIDSIRFIGNDMYINDEKVTAEHYQEAMESLRSLLK